MKKLKDYSLEEKKRFLSGLLLSGQISLEQSRQLLDKYQTDIQNQGSFDMKIKAWHDGMSLEETKDLAYWERNMLALRYADGWYNDDVDLLLPANKDGSYEDGLKAARFPYWRRVLSLENGSITFHIPDDFEVGNLEQIEPNWDGHTTIQKWSNIARSRGIEIDDCPR